MDARLDARFVTSAPDLASRPREVLPEFAFAGRSNCGKSSLINHFLGRAGLAQTSRHPGKTRHLNYFAIDRGRYYLVDLPGYGYARTSQETRAAWARLIRGYLTAGDRPLAVFHLLDVRRDPSPDDLAVAGWLREAGNPFAIAVTKIDKIGKPLLPKRYREILQSLDVPPQTPFFPTSARLGIGRREMRAWVEALLKAAE